MKTRNGFVSNSSSSSFVILGSRLNSMPKEFSPNVWAIGADYGEGSNIFELTEEIHKFLLNTPDIRRELQFIKGIPVNDGEKVSKKDLPDEFGIHMLEMSYHSISTVSELKNSYEN